MATNVTTPPINDDHDDLREVIDSLRNMAVRTPYEIFESGVDASLVDVIQSVADGMRDLVNQGVSLTPSQSRKLDLYDQLQEDANRWRAVLATEEGFEPSPPPASVIQTEVPPDDRGYGPQEPMAPQPVVTDRKVVRPASQPSRDDDIRDSSSQVESTRSQSHGSAKAWLLASGATLAGVALLAGAVLRL